MKLGVKQKEIQRNFRETNR